MIMSFRWQIPSPPPDAEALDRMRTHLAKLRKSNYIANISFTGDIDYLISLANIPPEKRDRNKRFGRALWEIRSELLYVPRTQNLWGNLFKYLLPYAIAETD